MDSVGNRYQYSNFCFHDLIFTLLPVNAGSGYYRPFFDKAVNKHFYNRVLLYGFQDLYRSYSFFQFYGRFTNIGDIVLCKCDNDYAQLSVKSLLWKYNTLE